MFGSARGLAKIGAIGLIALMALGSVGLWVGIPLGWIYLVGSTAVRGKIPRERADRGEGPRDRQEGVGEP